LYVFFFPYSKSMGKCVVCVREREREGGRERKRGREKERILRPRLNTVVEMYCLGLLCQVKNMTPNTFRQFSVGIFSGITQLLTIGPG
jgi:hypothetical protein